MPAREGEVFLFGTAIGLRLYGLGDALGSAGVRMGRSHSGNNASRAV
jgi:hypothetical protein